MSNLAPRPGQARFPASCMSLRRKVMRSAIILASLVVAVLESSFSGGASAQICPANIPHLTGTWTVLPYQMPINPISASLLPDGKVLIVAGSENDKTNNSKGAESYRAAIWDPTRSTEDGLAIQNLTYDVFCSGTAALPDGRSLIVGGTSDYTFTGENRASIFNPATHNSCNRRAWSTVAGTPRRPLSVMDESWPCPGSSKTAPSVGPWRSTISETPAPDGAHRPVYRSLLRSTRA